MNCLLTIGHDGITATVLAELEKLFVRHELVKVKLLAERDERAVLCAAIVEKTGAAEAGAVGKTALFFRPNADPKARVIELPRAKTKSAE